MGVDQFKNSPEPTVMRWGFILVTLYMGSIGLLYVMADKEPAPGMYEDFTRPGRQRTWRKARMPFDNAPATRSRYPACASLGPSVELLPKPTSVRMAGTVGFWMT